MHLHVLAAFTFITITTPNNLKPQSSWMSGLEKLRIKIGWLKCSWWHANCLYLSIHFSKPPSLSKEGAYYGDLDWYSQCVHVTVRSCTTVFANRWKMGREGTWGLLIVRRNYALKDFPYFMWRCLICCCCSFCRDTSLLNPSPHPTILPQLEESPGFRSPSFTNCYCLSAKWLCFR